MSGIDPAQGGDRGIPLRLAQRGGGIEDLLRRALLFFTLRDLPRRLLATRWGEPARIRWDAGGGNASRSERI